MDNVFGSSGVAAADQERMAQINEELGVTRKVQGESSGSSAEKVNEKSGIVEKSEL
jgi:hypothetical protein